MKTEAINVDEYLTMIPEERAQVIAKIRLMIQKYFPDIEETMEYGMPTYKPFCAMASQKKYLTFYLFDGRKIEKYRDRFANASIGRSCIRYTHPEEFPLNVLEEIFEEMKS
ncbi:iron chaperone [Prolixibacter denitrificans]|uniref:Uncharacterized protein DUF1801 n=1 Tax=Prolixibacter denitrificans TaxID=1541063 RepID=A0A2P8CEJ2_9BACT|nr:DUF1801 domain-containing protein [Prolixibacter denitrificans]PSK83397.1 uncharacterized protein DUF1801 [Prolixibacter denitrificans]GET21722.1 hypothetical protein JCM18694_19680 [Prolixibacter denitrificans]